MLCDILYVWFRAHPAISHCSHLLLKCRAATNINHWLTVQSRWFKNDILAKKFILISFWIFQYFFYYSFTLNYCAIFYSLDAWIFLIPTGCQTIWILIRPHIMSGLIWVQTVCKGYQQTTKVDPLGQRVKYKTTCWYYFLAKTLAKVNFIWLQLFPFGLSVGYNKFWARVRPVVINLMAVCGYGFLFNSTMMVQASRL